MVLSEVVTPSSAEAIVDDFELMESLELGRQVSGLSNKDIFQFKIVLEISCFVDELVLF